MRIIERILSDDLPHGWKLDVLTSFSYEKYGYFTELKITTAKDAWGRQKCGYMCINDFQLGTPSELRHAFHMECCRLDSQLIHEQTYS